MAPDVLRRTPHDAGVLDRTGIVSASAPLTFDDGLADDSGDVPPDAFQFRPFRSQFAAMVAVGLMVAAAVTGTQEREGNPVEVARGSADDSPAAGHIPAAPNPRQAEPAPREGEQGVPLRTPPSASGVPETSSVVTSVEPTLRTVVPSVVPPAPGKEEGRDEVPVSVEIPSEPDVPGEIVELPMTAVVGSLRPPDAERLRARDDEWHGECRDSDEDQWRGGQRAGDCGSPR
ncbi:hypothetical protein [Saccharomonospora xinjiangensis]|uniref:Uncharacterized protein n=1 Tax=Saccharomonospora xinjiangensis XJ-54 TaxID=882086 RepID=I0V1V6_9PSEU|nr:hypothetical protein [Saccharomonospora xinjiangensis]EID54109.1 hypothetical protein SacxiDRAFT_1870 [Saccharomonospora xinjiangensis XJ-54]